MSCCCCSWFSQLQVSAVQSSEDHEVEENVQRLPQESPSPDTGSEPTTAKRPKFKFLQKLTPTGAAHSRPVGPEAEVSKYLTECSSEVDVSDGLAFWLKAEAAYPLLAPLAQDIVSTPASEAYCERIFSFCGDLTARKRNRASKSLEVAVFLKFNEDLLKD